MPIVTIENISELENEDEFVAMLEAKMQEADCGIVKVSSVYLTAHMVK